MWAKTVKDEVTSVFTPSDSKGALFKIGRPCMFHDSIDPGHRVGQFLRSKMSIIDLIPCHYTMDLSRVSDDIKLQSVKPVISYDDMKEYAATCKAYGLDSYDGIRIYSTDDSSAVDSWTNDYSQPNYLESTVNSLAEKYTQIRSAAASIGGEKQVEELLSKGVDAGGDLVAQMAGMIGAGDDTKSLIDKAIGAAGEVIVKGHRISFPTLWSNSSYQPQFQVNVKLVSPYGHPNAVKEFIIRPLMHLLIIGTPKTDNGVLYYRPRELSIIGYGMSNSLLGAITNINLRRGGASTSFNLYKQPLTVDVSITFQLLVKGFGHFTDKALQDGTHKEQSYFSKQNWDTNGDGWLSGNPNDITKDVENAPTLSTVGKIVDSFKPIAPESDMSRNLNIGDTTSTNIDFSKFLSSVKTASNTNKDTGDNMSNALASSANHDSGFANV